MTHSILPRIAESVVPLNHLKYRCKYLYVNRYKNLSLSASTLSSVNCLTDLKDKIQKCMGMQDPFKCATNTYVVNVKVAYN